MKREKFNEVVKSYLYSIYENNLNDRTIEQISKKVCSLFVKKKK